VIVISAPTVVQWGPMTEPKPADDGDDDGTAYFRPSRSTRDSSGTDASGPVQRDFERGLSLARLTVLLPVVVLVLSGIGAYIYGTAMAAHSVADIADHPFEEHNLRLFLVEIDLFLIGATLIIAAIGLYELFVARIDPANSRRPIPDWLVMNDLNDLKARVISMIILVSAVSFADVLLEFGDELKVLYLAAGVGIFIVALTIYLRFGSDNGGDHA
jgi:uncharacterized membrane protein YqhA